MPKAFQIFLLVFLCMNSSAFAYQLSGPKWPSNSTTMYVDFPDTNSVWNDAFDEAALRWTIATNFEFSVSREFSDPCIDDQKNGVGFVSSMCGTPFGSATIAVTITSHEIATNLFVEADMLFNISKTWDVYSGPLNPFIIDFRRVAVHELGHVIGLDHENILSAIMAPEIGDHEVPQPDDIDGATILYGSPRNTMETFVGDFNGDGNADIFRRYESFGANEIYFMDGAAVIQVVPVFTVTDVNWKIVGIGDFNNDSKDDILWRHYHTGLNWIWLMNGNRALKSAAVNTVANMDWHVVGIGDFDADGRDDILWRNIVTGSNWSYLINGTAIKRSRQIVSAPDVEWTVVGVGDFNLDGRHDILWRHQQSGSNWIWMMNGQRVISSHAVNTVPPSSWKVAGIGDFDNNGINDILWRNNQIGFNYIYFMRGATIVRVRSVYTVSDQNWQIAAVADFNNNDKADILWQYTTNGRYWLYMMNGNRVVTSAPVSGN